MTPEQLMSGVDMEVFQRLSQGPVPCGEKSWRKFFDWRKYGRDAIDRTNLLGLNRSKGKKVLDVGCGFGYFCRACQKLGHEVVGIDVPDENFLRLWSVMGLTAYQFALCVNVKMPRYEDLVNMDVITMWGFGLPREINPETEQIKSCTTWEGYRWCVADLLTRLSDRKGSVFATLINIGRDFLLMNHRWQSLADEFGLQLRQQGHIFFLERV